MQVEVGGARARPSLRRHCSTGEKAVAIENSDKRQLRFLEELASLLQPQTTSLEAEGRETSLPSPVQTGVASGRLESCGLDPELVADAREFLNSAELLLVSQRKRTPQTEPLDRKKTHPPAGLGEREKSTTKKKVQQKQSSRRHSSTGSERGGSLSSCWLKESEEKDIREWLKRKERESDSKRLAARRERGREKTRREEKARERKERETRANEAYTQWQSRKSSEESEKRAARRARDKQVQLSKDTQRPSTSQSRTGGGGGGGTPAGRARSGLATTRVARQSTTTAAVNEPQLAMGQRQEKKNVTTKRSSSVK